MLLGSDPAKESDGFSLAKDHPLAAVPDVVAPLWGDFDNDGLVDVYLCRRGPNQLWRQSKSGEWNDVRAQRPRRPEPTRDDRRRLLDLDHDADLDLLLIHRDKPAQLLNNNRDGTFEDIRPRWALTVPALFEIHRRRRF
ncbi:MAG: hypothetical protein Ct9H300mP1_04840 [Planctomycetaceae bacterium]|nr:MAG: hypothetical protein Ct9H300mP1_04840 [Planctomycetaceae bacterium]